MLVDKQNDLMSDLLFTVHQHGGDDVTWKLPISQDSSQDFAFPPFSRPVSPMTIKRTVFVAIMEGKHELGLGLGQSLLTEWLEKS